MNMQYGEKSAARRVLALLLSLLMLLQPMGTFADSTDAPETSLAQIAEAAEQTEETPEEVTAVPEETTDTDETVLEPETASAVDTSESVTMFMPGFAPKPAWFEGTLVHEGTDYTVTATIRKEAELPKDVAMRVAEILPGTELYEHYREMMAETLAEDEEMGEFARLFDIAFIAVIDGEETEVEPATEIEVQITFREAISVTEETDIQAVHFEENRPEAVEVSTDSLAAAANDDTAIDTLSFNSDSFSVYGFFQKVKKTLKVITANGDDFTVDVTFTSEAGIPDDAELIATEIIPSDPSYEFYRKQTTMALGADDVKLPGLFDLGIYVNGEKIQPEAPVSVAICLNKGIRQGEKMYVVHFPEEIAPIPEPAKTEQKLMAAPAPRMMRAAPANINQAGEQQNTKSADRETEPETHAVAAEVSEASVEGETVTFEANGFSVYALAYTVDFEYSVNGKTFEFSLPGGGFIPLWKLAELFGIYPDDGQMDVERFANDITDAVFSDPTLVWVGQANTDMTIGELKSVYGLECEYSTELTEAQIGKINNTAVSAGEWILVSLKPFTSEETLTVTLMDGEVFTVRVTDAQIIKEYITDSGETYTITVIYGEDAQIPDGADLRVREIVPGSEEYAKYIRQSAQKLNLVSSDVSFARFFDIEIADGNGEIIEPGAPVQVEIRYKDKVEIGDDETLSVVHFGEGTEVITDLTLSDDATCITYIQNSFSVTGTIVNGAPAGGERQYMVIAKDGNRYYIVNNNGTLTEVGYDANTNTVIVTNPMLWTFDNNGNNNRHIYFNSMATGFGDNQIASDFYRRYLVPDPTTGSCLEETRNNPAGNGYITVDVVRDGEWYNNVSHENVETNHVGNRNNALNATSLNISTNGNTSTISHNGQYLTIVRDGAGNPVSLGSGTSNAAQFIFAEASRVPSGLHLDNAVNHIDISIDGTATVRVPLAYGTYRVGSPDGPEWIVDDNVYLELKEDDIPDSVIIDGVSVSRADQLRITAEDMKRANIAAFDKNGEELNDAFYVTGYSQNATTSTSSEQIRIEGRFLVSDLRGTQYEHIDGNRYDGNWWTWTAPDSNYVNNVRANRLQNIVDYKMTVVKPIVFNLRDENNNQLYDAEGNAVQVTVDVAFSGAFNYWDYGHTDKNSGNECPPLQGNQEWRQGDIPNHDMSGMDFVLNGNANDPNSPLIAVEITKLIVDENGNKINVDVPVTSTISLYRSTTADRNSVKAYKVGGTDNPMRDDDTGIYEDSYAFVRDHKLVVGEGKNTQLIYDYNVSDGMYYIVERTDEGSGFAEKIQSGGEEWKYVKTYIETEYVKRGYSEYGINFDTIEMHRSDDYTPGDVYRSSPEVIGYFDPVTGERKKSAFLEYYVYNVYTRGKSLTVEKEWDLPEGEDIPGGAEVTTELYYATRANSGEAWPDKEAYQKVAPGAAPFGDYTADILTTTLTLSAANNWKNIYEGLPDKVMINGTACEVDYDARETAVKLPGPGKETVDDTAVDVTNAYTISSRTGEDGGAVITNKYETVELDAEKKWAEGTRIPEGAEVTAELRFETRIVKNADGTPVEEPASWTGNPEPVKGSEGYADVFRNDPRFDETKIVTELILKADTEHPESNWKGAFDKLPKYLIAADGSVLEVNYYADETKVTVPDGQNRKDVTADYLVITEKENGEDGNSAGLVTITNENNVTRLEVEKTWAMGTTAPEGATVTAELYYAARMIRNADGADVDPVAEWPMKEDNSGIDYEAYEPVKDAELFENAGISSLVTEITLSQDDEHPENSWYGAFENLPRFLKDSTGATWELDYYAVETAVNMTGEGGSAENQLDNYIHTEIKTDAQGDAAYTSDGSIAITNSESVIIKVKKEWKPSTPSGAEAVVQLKRYMAEGTPPMPKTEATIVKVWDDADNQDGKRPGSLTMTLYADGVSKQTVTLNADNSWTQTIGGLDGYRDDFNTPVAYTWEEDTASLPDGYTMTSMATRGTVCTMTNSYTPGKTAATVRVIWDDANDQDGKRPDSVEMTLSNGDTVTLNAENSWTATISNLPEYAGGNKINYTWTAPGITDYNDPDSTTSDTVTAVTYHHDTETTERTIHIVWDDENDQDQIRPASVNATLSNGDAVTVTAEDNWSRTVSLPKNAGGQPITYTWTGEPVSGYTITSEANGNDTTLIYSHSPKEYVTVTIRTILREAREGYYTDWEVNGWNTNIYNLSAQYQNGTITLDTIKEAQGDSTLGWNDQRTYISRGPLSFDVDKNTNVSFHMDIGGTGVYLANVMSSAGTVNNTGSNNSADISFNSGASDITVYVVLAGDEIKLPENSTVSIVVSNSGEYGVPKDPNSNTNGFVKQITVPVNSNVSFNYDGFYNESWHQEINPGYTVYWWHDTQYEHKWEAVSPEISGNAPPDADVVFNVGMKERYLILINTDSSFKNNLNCTLVNNSGNRAFSSAPLRSASPAGKTALSLNDPAMNDAAGDENQTPEQAAAYSFTIPAENDLLAARSYAAPRRAGGTSVTTSQAAAPEGYGEDTEFTARNIRLTLNERNGWEQSFPAQEKYDRYGRPYVYYAEEVSFTPSDDYYTESMTGPDENGLVTIVNRQRVTDLTIIKTITGDITELPAGKMITFTIVGSGVNITKTYPTDFTNGSVTIGGLRPSTTYTVTESGDINLTGYTRTTTVNTTEYPQSSSDPVSGQVTLTMSGGSIAFENHYEQNKISIPVNKVWVFANPSAVTDADTDDWPDGVTVTVKLHQTVNDVESETGKQLELSSAKQSDTFTDLPTHSGELPITYTVKEEGVTGVDGDRFITAVSGSAEEGYTITNTEKTASLIIIKSFTGETLSPEQKANVSFTVTGTGLPESGLTKVYSDFADGQWKLTQADGIRAGITYTVTETNADITGYTRTSTIRVNSGEEATAGETIEADVPVDAVTGEGTVTITNNYTIEKTVIEATKAWKQGNESINATIIKASVTFELQRKNDEEWTRVEQEGLTNPVTLTVGDEANVNAWKATWSNLPKYEIVNGTPELIKYQVVENAATLLGDSLSTSGPAAVNTDGTAEIVNTLPEVDLSVTKQWKDGTSANADRIFREAKSIGFTLYQKLEDNEANVYTAYGDNGHGTVNYTPATDTQAAAWETVQIESLPAYVYDSATGVWLKASYYVVEDPINGVTVTYKLGESGEAATEPAASAASSDNGITIINTDTLVDLNILKVDADDMTTPLAGATFTIQQIDETSSALTPIGDPETATTGNDGEAAFTGLKAGYYVVTETKLPAGYVPAGTGKFYIRVDNGEAKLVEKGESGWTESNGNDKLHFAAASTSAPATVTVGNKAGTALPSTGGEGIAPYIVTGIALMAFAGILLLDRKRKAHK